MQYFTVPDQEWNTVSEIFKLRWLLWGAGVFFIGLWSFRQKKFQLPRISNHKFKLALLALCLGFVALGFLAKVSQLWALKLNAQDFWLFEDMIRFMQSGAPFLSRFAPQEQGWVQHGVIHSFWTWFTILPFSLFLGPTYAALLHNPLVLGGAGWILGRLCLKRLGPTHAFWVTAAFLASTQVGKIHGYDVHPEAAYPLFIFLFAWGLGLDAPKNPKPRWKILVPATLLLAGVKEDSILILFPLLLSFSFVLKDKKTLMIVAGLSAVAIFFQFYSIQQWKTGNWGPHEWGGTPVFFNLSTGPFGDLKMESLSSGFQIFSELLARNGGAGGSLLSLFEFLISRPWISILIFFPWLIMSPFFWLSILPISLVHALYGGIPSKLMLYYSAPFIGIFWLWAVQSKGWLSPQKATWTLIACLLLGSGSFEFFIPSNEANSLKSKLPAYSSCIDQIPGKGIVPSYFIHGINREKIYTDRFPRDTRDWDKSNFVLFTPNLSRFENPRPAALQLLTALKNDSKWLMLDQNCKPKRSSKGPIFLFVKKSIFDRPLER